MKPKNMICLWFDKDAHGAARFYAATFPDSRVSAVHQAPSDYPGGKEGDLPHFALPVWHRDNDAFFPSYSVSFCQSPTWRTNRQPVRTRRARV
jgi:hypothetical protein